MNTCSYMYRLLYNSESRDRVCVSGPDVAGPPVDPSSKRFLRRRPITHSCHNCRAWLAGGGSQLHAHTPRNS